MIQVETNRPGWWHLGIERDPDIGWMLHLGWWLIYIDKEGSGAPD